MMTRVRSGGVYVYDPVPIDRFDPPHGVKAGFLAPGDVVRVVKLPGCPAPNTMGHCHVQTTDGRFAGLVSVHSLVKVVK